MKLRRLQIRGMPVTDLTPLRELPLDILQLTFSAGRGDAAVLRAISTLETINDMPTAELWKEVDAK